MSREMSVSDSVVVRAEPATVYAQVADPSQMRRWSPENTGATTPSLGSPLSVGDVFVGTNRRGRFRWQTRCQVSAAEPGRHFAFRVFQIGVRRPLLKAPIATWHYAFEAVQGGTRVTETWRDDRRGWPDPLAAVFDTVVTGGSLFPDFQRRNIARTLSNLRADLEP
ncbi:MAG: SRPBCC family protein [Nocardioides sp.]|nr:SRPBCC family protein [Nocardioides sp.]